MNRLFNGQSNAANGQPMDRAMDTKSQTAGQATDTATDTNGQPMDTPPSPVGGGEEGGDAPAQPQGVVSQLPLSAPTTREDRP